MNERAFVRDISYAHSASTKSGRTMIKFMENATGRMGLIKRARGYEEDVKAGKNFWNVMVERYGLSLEVALGSLEMIPDHGPLILISNHPYGILDGLMMGHILSSIRGDFRIIAHKVFRKAEEVNRYVLPISFDGTREALALNLDTRKVALDYLAQDGAIGIFPGGTVSTSLRPMSHPIDPGWRSFTARMVSKSNATVVPLYFDGHTSRLFQLASHLHYTLRMGLLIKEFKKRVDTPVKIAIGAPIERGEIEARAKDPRALMDFFRKTTYALSPTPLPNVDYGFEFEQHYKGLH